MNKDQLKGTRLFFLVSPAELDTFEEWAQYLEAILNGQCSVMPINGQLTLLEIKALVANVSGLKIEIFSKEHAPPHFHVHSANVDATFKIDDCSLLNGNVSGSDYDKVRYWHQYAKTKLIEAWNSTRPTKCTVGPYKGK
jgi:hypothetical protein